MMTPEERDELLWASIEAGTLDDSAAADTEIVARFAAHQKLESLFAMLREPSTLGDPLDQPSQIGRYRVEKALGEGAFGKVYRAHDPELDRLVAIKMPRADIFSSEQDADRFLEEAKLAASLNHPGIVTIHDVGREARSCFIVMEYIEGQTLQELISAGKVPHTQAADLVARVADALHYAHKKGFVHRDLKPGNILVDGQGQAHVTDFGLAVSEESQRLHAGQVAGTPAYMSPEQVRGETQHLDGRTDIWSLGVIFYQLLTGRHPFWRGDSAECLDAIEHREPKPPRQIDDTIPADLEKVCLRCLSKDITHRYSTAADLASAMRKLSGSREPPLQSASPRWRHVWWLLLGAVCASLAIIIGILLGRPAGDLEPAGKPMHDVPKTTLDLTFGREHPEVADLLRSVYDEVLQGSSPAAWIQVERREEIESAHAWRPLENGSRLSNNDKYRIMLRAPKQTYFYVFQIDTRGQVDWVFPKNSACEHSTGANPVHPDTTIKVPEGDGTMFFLDDHAGIEHVYVVATTRPWEALETQLADLSGTGATPFGPGHSVDKPIGLRLRGIGGIVSDEKAGSSPTTGANGVLATEVWFYHVQSGESRDE